jgi:hypothetical protein
MCTLESCSCESKSLETQEVGEFEIRGSLVAAEKNTQEDLDQKKSDKQHAWSHDSKLKRLPKFIDVLCGFLCLWRNPNL